ncbi:uncharacterized protein N7477_002601 [Penicillium maclennaniae]|uniref:uncharacterized protein n=1 Tax=Penicillium maclennaniae TaxID=1343394 RepID=UPI0025420DCD|nr:uncharacterized protein N7477_002601 [Penicillium maclennaniae]KAJ5676968.1 hypothetical protein N7477_002601 [Penicillium maclennaniae]
MSATNSPIPSTDSQADTLQPESTVPSSPMTDLNIQDTKFPLEEINDKDEDVQMERANGGNEPSGSVEDTEGMDTKSKALMHLLKTSSVFVAIMSEKMQKQQEEARQQAAKQKKPPAESKAKPNAAPAARRQTRSQAAQDSTAADKSTGDESSISSRRRGRSRKSAENGNTISSYFQKADVDMTEDKPTVQEALEQAADDFEANPTALGEQELVATQQPTLVTGGRMRKYQLEGLEWLKTLWMNGLCGILADEMGLGKTVQSISMIAFLKENNVSGPFLIAAPPQHIEQLDERAEIRNKHLKIRDQMKMDFPIVCTSYDICINDRKFLAQYQWRYIIVDEGHRLKNMNCRLIKELMSYNSANRLLITGTPLQNNISELWSLLHFLLPDVFNDLNSFEKWFDFSSVLDDNGQAELIERRKRNLVSTMHSILKPFLLRRVKTDVEDSLPKKREYILYAPMTPEQKELYREIISGTGRQYLEGKALERLTAKSQSVSRSSSRKRRRESDEPDFSNKTHKSSESSTPTRDTSARSTPARRRRGMKNYKEDSDREFDAKLRRLERGIEDQDETAEPSENELEEIERAKNLKLAKKEISQKKMQNPVMQARLACNSPHNFYWPWTDASSAVDESLVSSSGKMLLLDRLIPCLLKKGHKILIFSQFKTQLDILEEWAAELRGWKCCRIDGAIAQADRQEQIEAFNKDKQHKIFLLSTRAGGQGINLTAADTVILFDSDWNPQQDLQAQDRAHRIGQTKPVIVYRLATKGTVEQTLLEKADSKRRLERLVIQKGKFRSLLDPSATAQDMEELRRALGEDEFERFETGADPESILSDHDLDTLTDRSEEAYLRAEKGLEQSGPAFVAVESKRDGGESLMA